MKGHNNNHSQLSRNMCFLPCQQETQTTSTARPFLLFSSISPQIIVNQYFIYIKPMWEKLSQSVFFSLHTFAPQFIKSNPMKETKTKAATPEKHVITFNGFTFFDERLITLREAANLLGWSLPTLYSRMDSGKIQLSHVRLTEYLHRLKLTEIAALLDETEQFKIYNTKLNHLPDLVDIPTACKFLHISPAQFYRMMNPANPDKFPFPVSYTSTKRKVLKEDLYNYIDLKTFSR